MGCPDAAMRSVLRHRTPTPRVQTQYERRYRDGSSERNPTAGENACRPAGGWRCERRRACEEHNRLAEHPEVREKLSAMMAAHWEYWVDQPIPILGNRTPRESVRNRDGREIVESIVIQAEQDGRSHLQTDEDVFRRLRERLGLPAS